MNNINFSNNSTHNSTHLEMEQKSQTTTTCLESVKCTYNFNSIQIREICRYAYGASLPKMYTYIIESKDEELAQVIKNIQNSKKKSIHCLNREEGVFQLTPLLVAAMTCNHFALQLLLEAGADPNVQDWKGFTALHHAAVFSDKVASNLLISYGAKEDIRNFYKGRASDILQLVTKPSSQIKILYEPKNQGDKKYLFHAIPKDIFTDVENPTFSDYVYTGWERILLNWCKVKKECDFFKNHGSAFEAYLKNPPSLYIREECRTDDGRSINVGAQTCAFSAIPAGSVICEYAGEEYDRDDKCNDHTLDFTESVVDAYKIRSFGGMCSDSLPNCVVLAGELNGRERSIFRAIENIKPGDPIVWDYEVHSSKSTLHHEIRPQALRNFFSKNRVVDSIDKLFLLKPEGFNVERWSIDSYLDYLMSTPNAVVAMLIEELISIEDVNLLKNRYPTRYVPTKLGPVIPDFMHYIKRMNENDQQIIKEQFSQLLNAGEAAKVIDLVKRCGYEAQVLLHARPAGLRSFISKHKMSALLECYVQGKGCRTTREWLFENLAVNAVDRLVANPLELCRFYLEGVITQDDIKNFVTVLKLDSNSNLSFISHFMNLINRFDDKSRVLLEKIILKLIEKKDSGN